MPPPRGSALSNGTAPATVAPELGAAAVTQALMQGPGRVGTGGAPGHHGPLPRPVSAYRGALQRQELVLSISQRRKLRAGAVMGPAHRRPGGWGVQIPV